MNNKNISLKKLCDFFPYSSFDPKNKLFFHQNRVGFVLETAPISGLTGGTKNLEKELRQLLPGKSSLQITLFADPHIGDFLDQWKHCPDNSIMKSIANSNIEHLKSTADNATSAPYVLRNFRIFICFSQTVKYTPAVTEQINRLKNTMCQRLNKVGLLPTAWDADQLITTIDRIININPRDYRGLHTKCNNLQNIKQQIATISKEVQITAQKNYLRLQGGLRVKTYHAKKVPVKLRADLVTSILSARYKDFNQTPGPFMVSYKFYNKMKLNRARLSVVLFAEHNLLGDANQILCRLGVSKRLQFNSSNYVHLPVFINAMPMLMMPKKVA
jgi:hypothetical protein